MVADVTGSNISGVLSAGETEDKDGFAMAVTSGAVNDDLVLELACTDGVESYSTSMTLTSACRHGIRCRRRDAAGDAVGGYEFDLLSGQYRTDGVTLDVGLVSASSFDSATVFVEAWASSPGADYAWYQFVVQGGSAKVRGYDGKFHDLSVPKVDFPSSNEVVMSVDIASKPLQDTISIGLPAVCGGSDYYCDHYPDAWGSL